MNHTTSNGVAELLLALMLLSYAVWGFLTCVKSYEAQPQGERRLTKADRIFLTVCACFAHIGFTLCELAGNNLLGTSRMSVLGLAFMNVGTAMLYLSLIRGTWQIVLGTATGRSLARNAAAYAGGIVILWACM